MTEINSVIKRHSRKKDSDDKSHDATVSHKVDNACRSRNAGMDPNLATFRIPRKQNHEGGKNYSVSPSDDLRQGRKKVNFGPDTLPKAATQKHVNGTANTSATHAANIGHHDTVIRHSANRHWGVAGVRASNRNADHSTSGGNTLLNTDGHPSRKFTVGVPSRLTKPSSDACRNTDAHTNKQQQQHSAVVSNGNDSITQSEPQEVTPKLPEELIRAGWKLCWSKQRHRWYVFNVRTGTSSWDVPK